MKAEATFKPEDADKIRELLEHPGWKLFVREVRKAQLFHASQALRDGSENNRQQYLAISRVLAIPHWIIADTIEDPTRRIQSFPDEDISQEDVDLITEEADDYAEDPLSGLS